MKTVTVSWNRFLAVESRSKQSLRLIKQLEKRLDRLTKTIRKDN